MIEKVDLKQIEQNVFRDYCQDGLFDMILGTYFLAVGLSLPTGTVAPFLVLPVVFFTPLLRGLKKRFTYPRTGHVELRQGDPSPLPWLFLGSFVLGLIALIAVLIATDVITQPAQWYRWMPILFGIWMAGIFLGLALRVGLVRYYIVAGVALAAGPIFTLLPLTGKLENLGLFLALVGAVALVLGIIAFVLFLHQFPRQSEEDNYVRE
ncbi:MAG: DUF1704 domain-containing protein [Chloroflexi bacterium]|nr:DUF1704 domain-containing protein [Chloroflexota bacterium]